MPIQNIINDKCYILCSTCPPPAATHAADRLLRTRPTYSKSVMVSVGVSVLGQTNLHFVDPGVKVNGQYYRDILLTRDLLPDIKQYSDYFTFQQDGAPADRARETVELLKVETSDFIPPNLWPPNSPDLNPVDYKIWGILQERVCKTSSKDVDELWRRIAEEWDKLDQRIIDKAVGEWRKRLQACVAAGGRQCEQRISAASPPRTAACYHSLCNAYGNYR